MTRKLVSFKERNPSKNGLYFTLDNCSFTSICLFENGKWYKLNCTVNDIFRWFGRKKTEPEIRRQEISGDECYWLEE